MPPRRTNETLEAVRERLTREQRQRTAARTGQLAVDTLLNIALEEARERQTREQRQRTAARIGELAVQTQQNTARHRLSELAGETYLTAARERRQLEQARKEASGKPAAYESTSLVLVCLLLWVLVANALLVHYIYKNRTQVKRECITSLVYAFEILHIYLSILGLIISTGKRVH
jgi:hypothetical protein